MKAILLIAAAGLAGFFVWQQLGDGPGEETRGARSTAPVTLIRVETREYRERIPALGTLQAWESIDITSPVSQLIADLNFEDGDRVEAGQILATLRQDAERASLGELNARLADAQREVKRLTDLASKNQVAQTDLDTARTDVEVLRHQITEVRAGIADRTIVAPFAGMLGLREVSEGALVSTGQRLTTLDDLDRMRLQFTVPERYLGVLRPGMPIVATTAAFEGEFVGELTAIGSRVDPVARAVTARALIPNDAGRLRPGMLMEIEVAGEPRQVMMVPEASLQSRAARHFLWKIDGEVALRTAVEIGDRIPGWVVIKSGVSVGDPIVRDGVVRLSGNSMPVRVVED